MSDRDLDKEIYSEENVIDIPEEEENRPKMIEDEQQAINYAYGLSETRKEKEKIESLAQAERDKWQQKIDEVNQWEEEQLKPLDSKIEYMNGLLSHYHMKQVEGAENEHQLKKVKSIKLPYGITLKSKVSQPSFEVTDEDKYKKYAKENNLLKQPEEPKPKWGDIKKRLNLTDEGKIVDEDGQVVDFVKATQPQRSFEVK